MGLIGSLIGWIIANAVYFIVGSIGFVSFLVVIRVYADSENDKMLARCSEIEYERRIEREEKEFLKLYDANREDFKSAFPNIRLIETNEDFDLKYLTYLDDAKRIEVIPEPILEEKPEVLPEPEPEPIIEPEHFKSIEKREIVRSYSEVEDVRFNPIKASIYSHRGLMVQRALRDWYEREKYTIISYSELKTEPDIVAFKDGVFYVVSCKSWALDGKRIKAKNNSRTCYRNDILPEIESYMMQLRSGAKVKLILAFHNPLNEKWELIEVDDVDNFTHYSTSAEFSKLP